MHRRVRVPRDARRPAAHREPCASPAAGRAPPEERPANGRESWRFRAESQQCGMNLGLAALPYVRGSSRCGLVRCSRTAFAPRDFWWCRRAVPGRADLAVGGARPARERAHGSGSLSAFGTYAAGTWWLYIIHARYGQAPVWMALAVMAAPGVHHGRLPGGPGLRGGSLAAACGARRAGCCWCRRPGCCSNGGAAGFCPDFRGCHWAIRRRTPGWLASRPSAACTCSARAAGGRRRAGRAGARSAVRARVLALVLRGAAVVRWALALARRGVDERRPAKP